MKNATTLRPVIAFALAALIVVSCGGKSSSETTAESVPTTTPDPTATEVVEPTATVGPPTPEPTVAPTEIPTKVPTAVPSPTAAPTATPVPSATPMPTTPPEPTVTAVPSEEPSVEPTANAAVPPTQAVTPPTGADGASVFAGTCAFCHGPSGAGTSQGPPLAGIGQFFVGDASPLARLVTNGGTNMPEFGSKLTPEQIAAVADYVVAAFQ